MEAPCRQVARENAGDVAAHGLPSDKTTRDISGKDAGRSMARILIVDDEEGIRAVLSGALADAQHQTAEAASVPDALRHLEDEPHEG